MKSIQKITSLLLALAFLVGGFSSAKASGALAPAAAGSVFYVATNGSDSNNGSVAAPLKTLAKAASMLGPGSTLNIGPGTYSDQLRVTQSGSSSAPIIIIGTGAVIDMHNSGGSPLNVTGSYVTIKGLELKNSATFCADLSGSNLTVDSLYAHECSGHGIYAHDNSHVKILNSTVTRAVLSNSARAISGGWDSAIKVRISDDVLIQGNTLHHNYGEGIGSRGTNITIRGNLVYDNFSVNIYTNSENALIEKNFVYCTSNTGFERDGKPAAGIAMGEEYFAGWGARLKNARVLNNIVAYCKSGVRYNGAEAGVTGGGLKYATIANNTFYSTVDSAIAIVYVGAQAGNVIANNIVWQANNKLVSVSGSGLTFKNNLWKVLPPAIAQGPGDKVGNPAFVASNPGYTPNDYRPASSCLARGTGANLNILEDYFGNPRTSPFDMGAIQISSGAVVASLTPTKVVTATAIVSSPTPTKVITATSVVSSPTPISTNTVAPTQPAGTIPEITYDDKNSALTYSSGWTSVSSGSAYGGSYRQTTRNSSSATMSFTGTSFSLIYKGGPSYRAMDVLVDGAKIASIDQKRTASTYNLRWDLPAQLTQSQHTLKLVFVTSGSSTNGSVDAVVVRSSSTPSTSVPSSTSTTTPTATPVTVNPTATAVVVEPSNTPVAMDPTATAVEVNPTATPAPSDPTATPAGSGKATELTVDDKDAGFVYSPEWSRVTAKAAVGGAYAQTSTNGAFVTFDFTGTSFSIIYKGGPSYRSMDVYVDNQLVGTLNQKLSVSTYNARWDFPAQLPPGQHTLKLVFIASGSTNNGSLDALIVR